MSLSRRLLPAVLAAVALPAVPPLAAADPAGVCGPHSTEEKVVRVFARGPAPAGPPGVGSRLLCGNRYYGSRRIDAEWPGRDAATDDAIARTLAYPGAPRYDERSNTWTVLGEAEVVLSGGDGQVVAARPVPPGPAR